MREPAQVMVRRLPHGGLAAAFSRGLPPRQQARCWRGCLPCMPPSRTCLDADQGHPEAVCEQNLHTLCVGGKQRRGANSDACTAIQERTCKRSVRARRGGGAAQAEERLTVFWQHGHAQASLVQLNSALVVVLLHAIDRGLVQLQVGAKGGCRGHRGSKRAADTRRRHVRHCTHLVQRHAMACAQFNA